MQRSMLALAVHGWRSWKSARGVAILAVVALSVGIGSTTAIYTVVHAVLLKPLPYEHPRRWMSLYGAHINEPELRSSSSQPDLLEYQRRTRVFDVFGWYKPTDFNLTAPGPPQRLRGVEVMPSLAGGLGVNPILGRWFRDASVEQDGVFLAVISTGLWKRLGADPNFPGKAITLNNRKYTVVGVMPVWFRFPVGEDDSLESQHDVWVPLNPQGADLNRDYAAYFCYARTKPGVTLAQAEEDTRRVAAELTREFPREHHGYTSKLAPILTIVNQEIRPALLLLMGAAGVLLLITCANVAGLLLARSVARARETAVRVALGAGRRQLAVQYFVEGLIVSFAGAAGAMLLSIWLVRVVLSLAAAHIPRADEIAVNWRALAFALGAAVVTSVVFSLAPLWQALRTLPGEALSDGARSSAGARSRRVSRSLVVAQIALAFTLLALSGMLLAQLGILLRVRPGFDPEHLLTFRLNALDSRYPDMPRLVPYQMRLIGALQGVPGVQGVGFVNQLPLAGCCYGTAMYPEGRPADASMAERLSLLVISPDYFQTMRIPLIKGRFFDKRDTGGDIVPVIINQAAARHYWPDRDSLGAGGRLGSERGSRFKVVGVVGDVRNDELNKPTVPEVYIASWIVRINPMRFVVRSHMAAETLRREIVRAVHRVDPEQPVYSIEMMTDIVQVSVARQRLQSFIVSFFSAAALLMAMLGVYGVVAYSVRQRTVEIGTRMALGASTRDLLRLVLGDGVKMAVYGIGIGGGAVAGAAWLLSVRVFGIHIDDPRPFLWSAGTVVGMNALACLLPAWRATLISPMVAIRDEPGSPWRSARLRLRRIAGQVEALVAGEPAAGGEAEALAEIAEAGRHANSFAEASLSALERLRERFGARSLALFVQRAAGQPYRRYTAAPEAGEDGALLPADSLIAGRLRNFAGALPLDHADLDVAERWARANAPVHLAEISLLRRIGPALAVRLAVKQEISGLLFVGQPEGRGAYTPAEKRLLRGVSAQLAMMVENSRLTDRIVEQERLRRELLVAAEVQKRLFPESSPQSDTLEIAGVCLPARGVGGDYYDFLDLGDRRIGLALADVAGKGIAAALLMSVVQASLRSLAGSAAVPVGELASRMNRLLYGSSGPSSYATFFYAEVDGAKRQLRYVNAGHCPPLLLRNGRAGSEPSLEELSVGGTVIGLFPKSSYEEAVVDLRAGDVFIAFTDGVPEAINPAEEEFGEERLRNALVRYSCLPANELSSRLLEELKQWVADAAQYDDMTFVVMKVNATR